MPDQKAILLREVGKPVELGSRPIPVPKDLQVLIEVTSVMLLPHDSYSRAWGLFVGHKLPWVPGLNIAGKIVELGAGVSSVKLSDHVFGLGDVSGPQPDQAGLQKFAILNQDAIAKVPAGFTADQVATLPVNVVTSFMALFTEFGFNFPAPWTSTAKTFDFASQTIVILAAGSNVGKFAVQFAKIAGVGTIVCVAGLANEEELKRYGATHVIDRHASPADIVRQVHNITGEENVTHLYDCYSFEFDLGLDLLPRTKYSRFATLHSIKGAEVEKVKSRRPLAKAGVVPCANKNLTPHIDEFWEHIVMALESGKLFPTPYRVIEGLDVDKINEALDIYAATKPQAQVIVHV